MSFTAHFILANVVAVVLLAVIPTGEPKRTQNELSDYRSWRILAVALGMMAYIAYQAETHKPPETTEQGATE